MPQIQLTQPLLQPLTKEEVKLHLRIDGNALDSIIDSWIKGVTLMVQDRFRIQIVEAEWQFTFPFPVMGMDLPLPLVNHNSVVISYKDKDGEDQELDSSDFELVRHRNVTKIFWSKNLSMDLSSDDPYPVKVVYSAGFPVVAEGEDSPTVSVADDIKIFLKMLIGFVHVTPEGMTDGKLNPVMDQYRGYIRPYIRRYLG